MIKIIVSIVFSLISLSLLSQNKESGINITVNVSDFTNDNGIAVFSIFEKEGFLEKPIQTIKMEIKDGKTQVVFKNIKKGTYSILCHHDSNENGLLDRLDNGMPTEDVGVTNSIIRFGPPSFKKSKFEVNDNDLEIEIKF